MKHKPDMSLRNLHLGSFNFTGVVEKDHQTINITSITVSHTIYVFFKLAIKNKADQFQTLPQSIFKNQPTAHATLRPKKALVQSRNIIHRSSTTPANVRHFRCYRHYFKFSLVYTVLGACLPSKRTLEKKFCLKAEAKAHTSLQKRFRALRNCFRRRTLYPHRSLRHIVSWRRCIVFHHKHLRLRRAARPRRRRIFQHKSARRWNKRSARINKRTSLVKKAIKRDKKQKKHTLSIKRSRRAKGRKLVRANLRRRKGRARLRRWEKRRNCLTVLAVAARTTFNKRLRYSRAAAVSNLAGRSRFISRRRVLTPVKQSRRALFLKNSRKFKELMWLHSMTVSKRGYDRRQLRRSLRRHKKRNPRATGIARYYIRYQRLARVLAVVRARFRRWPFFVRQKRTFFPPRRRRKKILRFRRRAVRQRKLFISVPRRVSISPLRSYQLRLNLRRTVALRAVQHRNTDAFLLCRNAVAREALTNQSLTSAHALARGIVVARSFGPSSDVLPSLRTRTKLKLTRLPRRAKGTPAPVFLLRYLAPSYARSTRSLVRLRGTHATMAVRARRSRLQNFASIAIQAKLTARRSLFAGVRRARIRKLLKRVMWQKVFHKCRVMRGLRRKAIVRRARRHILARRFRAALSFRSLNAAVSVRRRLRRRHQKNMPMLKKSSKSTSGASARSLKTFANTKHTSKRLYLKPRLLRKNIIKNWRFKLFRRAARKLWRKVIRKFGRRSRRRTWRRRAKFRSVSLRRRHLSGLATRFKFKRAPHLVAQLPNRVVAWDNTFARLNGFQKMYLRSYLQRPMHTRRKLFDRYKFCVGSRVILTPRRTSVRGKWLFTNLPAVRHSKKRIRQQTHVHSAAQGIGRINQVPLSLQLFASQLTAANTLGTPFSPSVYMDINTTKVK